MVGDGYNVLIVIFSSARHNSQQQLYFNRVSKFWHLRYQEDVKLRKVQIYIYVSPAHLFGRSFCPEYRLDSAQHTGSNTSFASICRVEYYLYRWSFANIIICIYIHIVEPSVPSSNSSAYTIHTLTFSRNISLHALYGP